MRMGNVAEGRAVAPAGAGPVCLITSNLRI